MTVKKITNVREGSTQDQAQEGSTRDHEQEGKSRPANHLINCKKTSIRSGKLKDF